MIAVPRFAVLAHDWPSPHFDLLLEGVTNCRTWRLATEPRGDVVAERIGDHRKDYLEYEGAVSGGRGKVTRWDGGRYQENRCGAPGHVDEVVVEFFGERLRGRADWNAKTKHWTFADT
jgi:DNA polymerase Ligase (LigD)